MKRTIVTIGLVLLALAAAAPAYGHGHAGPACTSGMRLTALERCQERRLHAYRGAVRFLERVAAERRLGRRERRELRWNRAAAGWTARELAETRKRLHPPMPTAAGSSAVASWYGPGFYGNRTACGLELTTGLVGVAHKTLACGTRLLVCYRGRCAYATVVDRGPYVPGRDFDLTGGLAVALGFGGVGTITYSLL